MTTHILDSKKPSGELLLAHIWSERNGGYQDEYIDEMKLTVSQEGTILLTEHHECCSFGPCGGGSKSEEVYEISSEELVNIIKEKGVLKKLVTYS